MVFVTKALLFSAPFLLLALFRVETACAQSLSDLASSWRQSAPLCPTAQSSIVTPSKEPEGGKCLGETGQGKLCENGCGDGDMTLFNGLLCYAGEVAGCLGVAEAQDPVSGEWHRSPRIRHLGDNDQGNANFSPDMALGVFLYIIKTRDVRRANKWFRWLDQIAICPIPTINGHCVFAGQRLATFCEDPDCIMRPGDAALFAKVVHYLQQEQLLQELPDGPLRGALGTWSAYAQAATSIGTQINERGYPQHLTAVSILISRAIGFAQFEEEARQLANHNEKNAFFQFLHSGPTAEVETLTIEMCSQERQGSLIQWQWERDLEAEEAQRQSAYWDCLFMAQLLR